jgi:hypothetical protein
MMKVAPPAAGAAEEMQPIICQVKTCQVSTCLIAA